MPDPPPPGSCSMAANERSFCCLKNSRGKEANVVAIGVFRDVSPMYLQSIFARRM